MSTRALLAFAALAALGCRPTFDDRPWLITAPQIVTLKLEPPEVAPGAELTAEVLALAPGTAPDLSTTTWTLCHTPRPLGENRVADPSCLSPATPDATGSPAHLTVPSTACQTFGPNVPQPAPGAPPTRPNDPDVTGGYFQPITTTLDASLAVALERITCGLPDASLTAARAYQATYTPNQNPAITALTFTSDGVPADPTAVPAGARLSVEVAWSPESMETFPIFDRAANALADRREVLTASWYVTGGTLDRAASEVADPAVASAVTTWTAPPAPADLELMVVLRDSRGGTDARRATLVVR